MLENGFYNMDCMQGMKEFPDGYFDLAIVDPPYGIGVQSMSYSKTGKRHASRWCAAESRDYRRTDEWDIRPTAEYFEELQRVSKKQIIWGGTTLQTYCRRRIHSLYGIKGAMMQCGMILQIVSTHGQARAWALQGYSAIYGMACCRAI